MTTHSFRKPNLYILYYHNLIDTSPDVYERSGTRIPVTLFREQMSYVAKSFTVISLDDWIRGYIISTDLPLLALTFDDAYYGVLKYAVPILDNLNMPATIMVTTAYSLSNSRNIFHFDLIEIAFRLTKVMSLQMDLVSYKTLDLTNDEERSTAMGTVKKQLKMCPDSLRTIWERRLFHLLGITEDVCREFALQNEKYRILQTEEIRTMALGRWNIGLHSQTHRALATLTPTQVRNELAGALSDCARCGLTTDGPPSFAYPYGQLEHIGPYFTEVIKMGYSCGLTTISGVNSYRTDPTMLHRIQFHDLERIQQLF